MYSTLNQTQTNNIMQTNKPQDTYTKSITTNACLAQTDSLAMAEVSLCKTNSTQETPLKEMGFLCINNYNLREKTESTAESSSNAANNDTQNNNTNCDRRATYHKEQLIQ